MIDRPTDLALLRITPGDDHTLARQRERVVASAGDLDDRAVGFEQVRHFAGEHLRHKNEQHAPKC